MDTADLARWHRAKELFHAALDRAPQHRAAFVAEACGTDLRLRNEVDSLLASDSQAGEFIELPATVLLAQSDEPPLSRMLNAGDTLGRYEIVAFLGAGAICEVYRARDTRLGRTVALKIVTAASTPDASAWLLREAQHASTLNHSHICTVYEVEEASGLPFIVLEYLEGETLHTIVKTALPPLDAVLRWGAQIADALDHAHRRGIIHRDLKGSNVVVTTDGQVKVLDFGLARRVAGETADQASQASVLANASVAGTLTHIAPEVLRGEPVDARIDIWAVGVMLYEMVSGRLPFKGDTPLLTAKAILESTPPPLSSSVPIGLQRVIARCLSKDRSARYQSAADLRVALDTLAAVARPVLTRRAALAVASLVLAAVAAAAYVNVDWRPSVPADPTARLLAVLPLRETSGDETQRFLVDGMTEALSAELGRIDAVRVIASTTTARFRDRPNAVRDVSRETGAAQVLEGSVVRLNDRVRLSASLIEAATGRVIWSDEYDRHVRDVQALYGVVAAAVAQAIEIRLTAEDTKRLSQIRAVDPDVYEAYLKGRYYWNQRTNESLHVAVKQFQTSLKLDPTYAPAYAALADCYNQLGTVMVGGGSPQEWRPRAAEAAIKALQIDPELAEAHATLGYVRHYEWQWDAAEKSLRRAIALNPSYALARIWYANLLSSRVRMDEALREVQAAQELDPLSLVVNTNVGWVLYNARRYHDAIAQYQRTLLLDPSYVQAHSRLGNAYSLIERHADAIREYETAAALASRSPSTLAALAQAYAYAGRRGESENILDNLIAGRQDRYVSSGALANAYVALGRIDDALDWLERSHRERANNIAYLAIEPVYDPIRDQPRFQALVRAVGLP